MNLSDRFRNTLWGEGKVLTVAGATNCGEQSARAGNQADGEPLLGSARIFALSKR